MHTDDAEMDAIDNTASDSKGCSNPHAVAPDAGLPLKGHSIAPLGRHIRNGGAGGPVGGPVGGVKAGRRALKRKAHGSEAHHLEVAGYTKTSRVCD